MHNRHSYEEAKAILAEDIIQRDPTSFIHQTKANRLGWEGTLPKGAPYSAFMLNVQTEEEALKHAYSHANNTVLSMAVPFRVGIEISHNDDTAWTDRKKVHVSTKHFDENWLTVGQKMDIFTGLTVHEVCHLLYTDFNASKGLSHLASQLENLIEDERIEHRLGEEKPGFANYLAITKWYFFSVYCQKLREAQAGARPAATADEAVRLVNAILKLVRFRSALLDEDIRDFADPLIEVHDALMPYPTTPSEVVRKALEVEAIIRKYIKALPQQPDSGEGDNQDGQKQPNGNGQSGNGQPTDDQQSGDGEGQDGRQGNNQSSGNRNGSDDTGNGNKKENGKQTGKDTGKPGKEPGRAGNESSGKTAGEQLSQKELEDIVNKITNILSPLAERNREHILSKKDEAEAVQDNPALNKILSGQWEEDPVNGFISEKVTIPNMTTFSQALAAVKPYIPAMRNTLRANATEDRRTLTGMRSGTLDTALLSQAFQGVPNVYRTMQTVNADPVEVCLLIDESGSMRGEKSLRALETAVLISEALKGIPDIGLSVYGYSDCDESKLNVYQEHGHTVRGALGQIPYNSCGSTPTGPAMTTAARRMQRFAKNRRSLMFVITDGQPDSVSSVKRAVELLEKLDINIVAIGIEAGLRLEEQYKHYCYLTDLASLPRELAKIVKKTILGKASRHVA